MVLKHLPTGRGFCYTSKTMDEKKPFIDQDVINQAFYTLLAQVEESTKQVYRILWDALLGFLIANWFVVCVGLFILLTGSFFAAFITGRWRNFGSRLYLYLYYTAVFIISLLFGPESFANDYFKVVCVVLLGPVCYFIVGRILKKLDFIK